MNLMSDVPIEGVPVHERRSDRRRSMTLKPFNDVVVCVPCYNEAERLNFDVFEKFLHKYKDIHLVFVNDGSTDETPQILSDFTSKFRRQTHFLNLETNVGKAEAVRQGIQYCLELDRALIGYWDADLATDLSAIPDFARILREKPHVDVVMGARLKLMGHEVNREFKRLLVSKICNVLAKAALRQNFRDTQCGAKLIRRSDALEAVLKEPFETPWLFDVELFKRLKREKKSRDFFYEYPLSRWEEIEGSKIKLRTIVKSAISMLKLIISR